MSHPRFRAWFACLSLGPVLTSPLLTKSVAAAERQANGAVLPDTVPDKAALAVSAPQADIDSVAVGFLAVTPAVFAAPSPSSDTRYEWHFAQSSAVYVFQQDHGQPRLRRVVTIHYQPEDRPQAQRTTRLIARLLALHRGHFGEDAVFHLTDQTADVYLAQQVSPVNPTIGGETRGNQVYIYGTESIPRTALEWVRTVAHEWGHLTLAAARGYRLPENDAAGYLGERLHLKWLREDDIKNPSSKIDDGTTSDDLDLYDERQIAPLIERFNRSGPETTLLDGTSGEAMDYYIGAVLLTDSSYGSVLTGRALSTVLDVHPRDFLVSLQRLVAERSSITVRPPCWIPLPRGLYSTSVPTTNGKRILSKLNVTATGWRHFDGADDAKQPMTFTRVSEHSR